MNPNARSPTTAAIELLNFPDDRRRFEADPANYLMCDCGVYDGFDEYAEEVRSEFARLKAGLEAGEDVF